mmetsp:Transcript_29625/g.36048  ORF Transcript_29625/g.36048 Transcript_29625/m.36048 type:complete len:437 (+) Transcript_29625:284-1594(+)
MNLTIKTLKGGKFLVEVETSNTVAEVKGIIEKEKSELSAANMKLIHSGKVLKDDVTIEACQIKPNDFLVCMITKAKKTATPKATTPAPAPAPAASAPAAPAPTPALATSAPAPTPTPPTPAPATTTPSTTTTTTTPATPAPTTSAVAPPPAPSSTSEFPAEVVNNLTSMGFPEAEVRACLRAAHGNPDVAVEFLMNGIPPSATLPAPSSGGGSGGGEPLAALRNHPQFDALRRLVQSNPSTLQAVLTQIGQQQPELLQEINSNQATFLQMMNEPIADTPTNPTPSTTNPAPRTPADISNPAQMAQMLSSLSPPELNEMAAMMGISPDQLTAMANMIGQMGNQDQFQEYLQAMQGGGGGGGHVLRLTEEEMAAVDRLTEMGFDRAEAAQAFLACDKNEALAANLLMDSAGEGGFGGFGGGGGAGDGNNGDDAEDMYD